ncbi:hypothetical protein AgCh_000803 [Apium graveolens]
MDEDVPGTGIVERKWAMGRRDSRLPPHHSLPHYRGEFDGVAADIVALTLYAHFHEVEEDSDGDHNISAEDWEAHFFGLARISVICYDVVEYQHSDRVMRQFGFRHGYMQRYSGIVRMRVGKPKPLPEPQYSTRELFNNSLAFDLIQKGLACLQAMDNSIPPAYEQEFGRIAPMFLEPYCRFMQDVRGDFIKISLGKYLGSVSGECAKNSAKSGAGKYFFQKHARRPPGIWGADLGSGAPAWEAGAAARSREIQF